MNTSRLLFVSAALCLLSSLSYARQVTQIGLDGNAIPAADTIRANVGGESTPIGEITIFLGACPTGYAEVSALSGKFLLGTVNANGDVSQTGGVDSVTPAGTNAAITAGTPAGTIGALTTGADSSTTGGVAKAIAQTPVFTGSALATHTHVFTGTSFDNRPAFIKVIFCRKT